MSQFDYKARLDTYAPAVIYYLENNKDRNKLSINPKGPGFIEAIDGNDYKVDIKSANFKKFKTLVEDEKWNNLTGFLKNNEFQVLSPQDRDDKYNTLGWKEIQKKTFSSPNLKISTQQQERITLLIIKNLLAASQPDYESFGKMFDDKKSGLQDIFPKLRQLDSWWNNFTLQFNQMTKTDKFPNSKYDVYLYDEPGNFMGYVTELVTKQIKFVGQKDTWNPADIWLLKTGAKKAFAVEVDKILEKIAGGSYADDRTEPIREVNKLLRSAYKTRNIVGISLKKSDGKKLLYDEFNMNANEKDSDLPDVSFDKIQLSCAYNKNTRSFTSKTSYVFVNDSKDASYKLAYKSNTGKGKIGNITYEFLPSSKASAFLGKVPKESLKVWLVNQIDKDYFKTSAGIQMPQGVNLPKTWDELDEAKEIMKVSVIKKNFPNTTILGLDDYVNGDENLYHSFKNGLSDGNSTMMQMIDFTYILAKLKEQKDRKTKQTQLQIFLTKGYYFAQKKGVKYNFGPFGKLY